MNFRDLLEKLGLKVVSVPSNQIPPKITEALTPDAEPIIRCVKTLIEVQRSMGFPDHVIFFELLRDLVECLVNIPADMLAEAAHNGDFDFDFENKESRQLFEQHIAELLSHVRALEDTCDKQNDRLEKAGLVAPEETPKIKPRRYDLN